MNYYYYKLAQLFPEYYPDHTSKTIAPSFLTNFECVLYIRTIQKHVTYVTQHAPLLYYMTRTIFHYCGMVPYHPPLSLIMMIAFVNFQQHSNVSTSVYDQSVYTKYISRIIGPSQLVKFIFLL